MKMKFTGVMCMTPLLMLSAQAIAETWTLTTSVERAYQHAPEIRLAESEREAQQSALASSSYWPNPTVDVRVDNKLGLDDGTGGYDVSDMGITQPIPLRRMKYQKELAQTNVAIAEHALTLQKLLLENEVAKEFHELQYAQAEFQLAKERLSVASDLQAKSAKNKQGVIVRYMTPLERMRLEIIREEAAQSLSSAEGRYAEVLTRFEKRLDLDVSQNQDVIALEQVPALPELGYFIEKQSSHVVLSAQQQSIIAARAEAEVARSRQLNDPELRLSRSVDYFNQGQEDVYGLTLNVQIPLWNQKSAEVSRAEYNVSQRQIEFQKQSRELQIQIRQSHTHLMHLLEQTEHHRQKVLQPSAEMLRLTNKGFISGELNLLTLIDANNTYFDAQLRYAELMYESWMEYAELRKVSGILLSASSVNTQQNMNGGA